MKLKEKLVLVTGASSGIGAETARGMAREGARVALLARTRTRLDEVAGEIRQSGGTAFVYPVDLTNAGAVNEVARQIVKEAGAPDVLINNAGAGKWLSIDEATPEETVGMMAAPYFAAAFVTRAFLPEMLACKRGHIVNMTSVAAFMAWPGATAYTSARWAMRGFHEALRADLAGSGVHTTLVTFAKVRSSYWEHNLGSETRVPRAQAIIPTLSAAQAAAAIIDGVKRDKAFVVEPLMLRVVLGLNYLFPSVNRWMLTATGYRRPRTLANG
jgi:short-subunit dehydrogenase